MLFVAWLSGGGGGRSNYVSESGPTLVGEDLAEASNVKYNQSSNYVKQIPFS